MKLLYFGHSCFSVEIDSQHLLFDPFISPNELAAKVDVDSVRANEMLVSHAHQDHLADAVVIAKRTGCRVTAGFEVAQWFSKQGIENVQPVNHGGTVPVGPARAKFVNAIHSSSFPDGSYGGNPGGFVIESSAGNFYYSGDTALTADMKLIGQGARLDFAVLCIGDVFTMGVTDAIEAAKLVGVTRVVGAHYDTFPPIKLDHEAAKQAFKAAGIELLLAPIGGAVEV